MITIENGWIHRIELNLSPVYGGTCAQAAIFRVGAVTLGICLSSNWAER